MSRALLTIAAFAAAVAAPLPASAQEAPAEAVSQGFTRELIDLRPRAADIDRGTGGGPLHVGQWYWTSRTQDYGYYRDTSRGLGISMGGELTTAPRNGSRGAIPPIRVARGVFVEFEVALSDNDRDHFPALWMMPLEHHPENRPPFAGRPRDWEDYVEVDVDEGGFAKGVMGSWVTYKGVWPNQDRKVTQFFQPDEFDRSKFHRYGFSYDPRTTTARWFLDGRLIGTKVVAQPRDYAMYAIVSAQAHEKNRPYTLYWRSLKVWTR